MKYGNLRGFVMAWWHLLALQRIAFPVACSETIAKKFQSHNLQPLIIRNGVDKGLYSPATSDERIAIRNDLGLSSSPTIFVYIGSLIPRKDPKTMIEGFLTSRAKHNSKLLVIGDGPLRDSCETLAEGESAIQFVGHVSNVVDYLQAADYSVSSSLSEGLPNAVLEAMACGLPVCLSNIDSHQEILSLGKEAGVLFESGNSKSLADAMDRLIKADRALMTKKSLEIVENYLNAEQMSAQYQNLYARISGGQTG
jgi:glycosyltransferase involved in cell wall biosynthesis